MSIALILPGTGPSGALELFFHSLTAWPPAQPCTLYLVGFDALPPAAPADSVLVPAAGGYSACLAAGLTTALAKAEHTHFCLLHADTVLSPGWLDDLLAADADAVGPVTNFARTSQQLAGVPALRQNRFSVGKAADWAKNRRADFGAQPPVKAEQLSAFCLLLTRSAAQAVAGLPADLPDPALAEQGISLLLRQKGFCMVCCRGRYLHHWGGESRRGLSPDQLAQRFHTARRRLQAMGGWEPPAGELAASIAQDLEWIAAHPELLPVWQPRLAQGLSALQAGQRQLAAQSADPGCQMADGIYPEVPAGILARQLKHKAVRKWRSLGPVASHIARRQLEHPDGLDQLLERIAAAKAAGKKTVAILAPLFSDPTFSPEDGYIRRVKAVDEDVFPDFFKVYLYEPLIHLPASLRIVSVDEERAYVQYDPAIPQQRQQILRLAAACGMTYTHSLLRLMPHCWRTDPAAVPALFSLQNTVHIFDMHGAVPEEFALDGKEEEAAFARQLEESCVWGASVIVTVNRATQEHLRKRYGELKAQMVCMPIFNEDVKNAQPPLDKPLAEGLPVALYAGGVQAWQNIPLMQQAMAAHPDAFVYKMFLPDPDAFAALWGDKPFPPHLVLDCKTPTELVAEYQTAHYGFVLRDDITVNNVACPTKLVEYLQYGILPILLTPNIGDFAARGMEYLPLEDLLAGKLPSEEQRRQMAARNGEVLGLLLQDHLDGRRQLAALAESLAG